MCMLLTLIMMIDVLLDSSLLMPSSRMHTCFSMHPCHLFVRPICYAGAAYELLILLS